MADSIESMSNAELRTKLAEYGFPVMPVTASTRKLMAKKLKLLMESKNKSGNSAADRRSLAKYSSGEESDGEKKEKSKTRRTTTGSAMLPPATNKIRRPTPKKEIAPLPVRKDSESEEEQTSPVRRFEEVETVTTRRVTKTFQPHSEREEYETGSDSDVDIVKPDTNSVNKSVRSSYISSIPSRPSLLSDYRSPSTNASDNLNSIRSRLGLSTSIADRPSYAPTSTYPSTTYTSPLKPTSTDEIESPYLSSFTRRLSAMKAAESRNILKESDATNGSSAYSGRLYTSRLSRPDTDFKAVGERNILKNNLVSFTLVGTFCLFFLIICFAYYGMRSDMPFDVKDQSNIIPICQVNVAGHQEGVNCIAKHHEQQAIGLFNRLYPELLSRAIAAQCSQTETPPYMDTDAVIQYVRSREDFVVSSEKILTDLFNVHVLVVNNPKWGVAVVEKQKVYGNDNESGALRSMEEVLHNRMKNNVGLLYLKPSMPMSCLILNKLYSALLYGFISVIACIGVYGVYRLRKMYYALQKRKSDEIYSMVEQIIEIVSQEAGVDGGDSYLPVTHVRDMLIPPHNREKLTTVWDSAVRFIEKNESRVRFEVQLVDGEEFCVFRWISPGGSPRRGGQSWQGQAFETQEGSVNSLSVSPTPCLKIRHMIAKHDSNPNVRIIVQDAILEKCLGEPNILHVDIDEKSGCVYVKCGSPQDAGIVYKNLHGWWYEGNLITVKYIKTERYMERFPLSPTIGPYLKPSGRKFTL